MHARLRRPDAAASVLLRLARQPPPATRACVPLTAPVHVCSNACGCAKPTRARLRHKTPCMVLSQRCQHARARRQRAEPEAACTRTHTHMQMNASRKAVFKLTNIRITTGAARKISSKLKQHARHSGHTAKRGSTTSSLSHGSTTHHWMRRTY